ncbi:unnamed protein product [Allacma fusca]|uniref:Uncharacterized protein n=1 Tax=Allacma fusca TaxID=39272 RepID=A0A8J2LBI9_9HEXA|nr:unnamed protein product [Allacma fusca]
MKSPWSLWNFLWIILISTLTLGDNLGIYWESTREIYPHHSPCDSSLYVRAVITAFDQDRLSHLNVTDSNVMPLTQCNPHHFKYLQELFQGNNLIRCNQDLHLPQPPQDCSHKGRNGNNFYDP